LSGAAPGAATSGGDKLWEDNWDDDDIEDEFSVQLRQVLLKFHRLRPLFTPCTGQSWKKPRIQMRCNIKMCYHDLIRGYSE
jgi:hypothetical protein